MTKLVDPRIAAALSLYILSFLKMITVFVWFNKRSKIRRRVICAMVFSNRNRRSCWMKDRKEPSWWETEVPHFDDNLWIKHFRMRKATFMEIVCLVEKDMKPDSDFAYIRNPVPTEKRVALALFCLTSGYYLSKVAGFFGVHKTSAHLFFHRFCGVLGRKSHKFIKFPDNWEAKNIADRIAKTYKVPQVYSSIGATHIPSRIPEKGYTHYKNSLGWGSIILQAVVDDRHKFRSVTCSSPGGMDFSSVLDMSKISVKTENLMKETSNVSNTDIPLALAGGPEYPLMPWLLTPFDEDGLTPQEESFNCYLQTISSSTKTAFDRLKARWHILQKPISVDLDLIPRVILACCVLHNICEERETPILLEWLRSFEKVEEPFAETCTEKSSKGEKIREVLCAHMAANFPLQKREVTVEVGWGESMDIDESNYDTDN